MTVQSCMSPKPLGSIYRAASSGVCMHQHAGACLHVFLSPRSCGLAAVITSLTSVRRQPHMARPGRSEAWSDAECWLLLQRVTWMCTQRTPMASACH